MTTHYLSIMRGQPELDMRAYRDMLIMSLANPDFASFSELMDDAPDYPRLFDFVAPTGDTPLSLAAKKCDDQAMERLLGAGAAPDFQDGMGMAPLILCALVDDSSRPALECGRLLLSAGADPNSSSKAGDLPLESCFRRAPQQGCEPILLAYAIVEAGASMHGLGSSGERALFRAISVGSVAGVKFLLDCGVDPHALDPSGVGAMQAAKASGNEGALSIFESLALFGEIAWGKDRGRRRGFEI